MRSLERSKLNSEKNQLKQSIRDSINGHFNRAEEQRVNVRDSIWLSKSKEQALDFDKKLRDAEHNLEVINVSPSRNTRSQLNTT